ncbi:hypothetical protein E2C01_023379 [Portunus trituberculatus]|uniref:Uncharacterized protein n=1 Tax=Portunus trituberculatus TaxID=210409 RepID=A0A5B7E7U0_PORTR|nr:hypothetical protein [Portunus trituberculatus]
MQDGLEVVVRVVVAGEVLKYLFVWDCGGEMRYGGGDGGGGDDWKEILSGEDVTDKRIPTYLLNAATALASKNSEWVARVCKGVTPKKNPSESYQVSPYKILI